METSERTLKDIQDYIDVLGNMPLAGCPREELLPGLRSFIADKYVIYYRRVPEGILIMRVLHGARQFKYLFPEAPDREE